MHWGPPGASHHPAFILAIRFLCTCLHILSALAPCDSQLHRPQAAVAAAPGLFALVPSAALKQGLVFLHIILIYVCSSSDSCTPPPRTSGYMTGHTSQQWPGRCAWGVIALLLIAPLHPARSPVARSCDAHLSPSTSFTIWEASSFGATTRLCGLVHVLWTVEKARLVGGPAIMLVDEIMQLSAQQS